MCAEAAVQYGLMVWCGTLWYGTLRFGMLRFAANALCTALLPLLWSNVLFLQDKPDVLVHIFDKSVNVCAIGEVSQC